MILLGTRRCIRTPTRNSIPCFLVSHPAGLWAVTNKRPARPINTIVCDGKGGVEPWVGDPRTPAAQHCVGDCIYLHELMHATDALMANPSICAGKAQGLTVVATSLPELKASERSAYEATLQCLDSQFQLFTAHVNNLPSTHSGTHKSHKKSACPCPPYITLTRKFYENKLKQYK